MAIAFAILGAFFSGAVAVAVRVGIARTPDLRAGIGVAMCVGSLVSLLAAALAAGRGHGVAGLDVNLLWPFAVAGALAPGLAQTFFIHAVRDIGAARSSVMSGMSPLISSVVAVFVLSEPFRLALVIATALIVCGGIVLVGEGEEARPAGFRARGYLFAACTVAAASTYYVLARWAFTRGAVDPFAANAVAAVAAALVGGGFAIVSRGVRPLVRALPAFAAAGIATGLGFVSFVLAFKHGRVGIVAPLIATQSLFAVTLSALLLRKHERVGRRLVSAATLIVAGGIVVGAVH